jgi:hypothetical protein
MIHQSPRTAFLAVQYYLNHFSEGLGPVRKVFGIKEAEEVFSRLKQLIELEKLDSQEIMEAV